MKIAGTFTVRKALTAKMITATFFKSSNFAVNTRCLPEEQRAAFRIMSRFPQLLMLQRELKRCSVVRYQLLKVETCRRLVGITKWHISSISRETTRGTQVFCWSIDVVNKSKAGKVLKEPLLASRNILYHICDVRLTMQKLLKIFSPCRSSV